MSAIVLFVVCWCVFWFVHRPAGYHFFFDPQDAFRDGVGRKLPLSAQNGTFEPLLKSYITVTQLLVTVAAASIAFGGGNNQAVAVGIAKATLAWSIFYGVLFCAFLLWRYDEYGQDMESYTLPWYATISALGFSTLICFIMGYFIWGWGL